MDKQVRKWTTAWHAILDEEFGPEENANIEARYTDPCGDFRLHFCFWDLPDFAKRFCFEMLPLGDQIADRVIDHPAWETNMILSEAEAKRMLVQAIEDVQAIYRLGSLSIPILVSTDNEIRVLRGTQKDLDALDCENLDELWHEATEASDELPGSCELGSYEYTAVYRFLTEILYRRTSLYEGVCHALWHYSDVPQGFEPFANLLRMRQCEIEWLYDKDGLIIFYNDDATIRDGVDVTLRLNGRGWQDVTDQISEIVERNKTHQLKRGFSPERVEDVKIWILGDKQFRLKASPTDSPDGPDLSENRGIIQCVGKLTYAEFTLFYEGQKDGEHTDSFHLCFHYIDGKRQRAWREEREFLNRVSAEFTQLTLHPKVSPA
jgi:hypothetical protein